MAIHAQTNYTLTTKPAKTSLLGGHFIYRVDTTQGTLTPSSANIVQNVSINNQDVTDRPSQWGYNTHIGANGIKLRYNEIDLSVWTNSGLSFYNPSTHQANATLTSSGLILSKGGITVGTAGSNNSVYISSDNLGNTISIGGIKTDWRAVIGSKFAVDSEGNLYANNAHLSNADVEGAITATSLTIGSGSDTYNGEAAINASGYIIEIINDITAAPTGTTISDTQTYLYPIMRQNGEVINYLLTLDTTVITGKNYYIKTYDSTTQTYIYTLVTNPTGNPKELSYYEAIDKTKYLWTYNGSATSIYGDSTLGGIVATYNRTYRVSYILSDDEIGSVPSVQTIEVDPQKYITEINEYGIKIHPEKWTNQSSYIQLDGTGMELFNSNGDSIAQYGSTARIGKLNNSRFLINSSSLQAYSGTDSNPYFEVSANGLSWGSNTAATTTQVNAAAQTATNYLSYDSINGLQIASSSPSTATRKIQILNNAIKIQNDNNNYLNLNSNGVQIYNNGVKSVDFNNSIEYYDGGIKRCTIGPIESDTYGFMLGQYTGTGSLQDTYATFEGFIYIDEDHDNSISRITIESTSGEFTSEYGDSGAEVSLRAKSYGPPFTMHYLNLCSNMGWSGIEASVAITVNSDEKLKENIFNINNLSNILFNIKPISYSWKDKRTNKQHFGFIAQDVKKALDNETMGENNFALVEENQEGYLNLSYTELIPLMVDIIQKHEKRIFELESQLEEN